MASTLPIPLTVFLAARLLTARGWENAFRNALGEWQMLWKDILIDFLVAGLIAAFVPRHWWTTLFAFGSQPDFLAVVESALLGVFIGVVTFVCSVGNVPFALILWKNGIAFGGVMAFIFADLIVPTIVHAYRRYYGWRMALTLFVAIFFTAATPAVFWAPPFCKSGISMRPKFFPLALLLALP